MSGKKRPVAKGKKANVEAIREMSSRIKAERESGKSALEGFDLEEDEDVYDVVDEQQYVDMVEKRRSEGDFVVDDGKYMCFAHDYSYVHPAWLNSRELRSISS